MYYTHTNKMFNNGNSRNKQKAHPWWLACRRRLVNATRKMSRKAHKTEKFYIFLKKITTVNTSEYMCKYPIFKYHFTLYVLVCMHFPMFVRFLPRAIYIYLKKSRNIWRCSTVLISSMSITYDAYVMKSSCIGTHQNVVKPIYLYLSVCSCVCVCVLALERVHLLLMAHARY